MNHLAIDLGSESGRAVVGHLENGRLHTAEVYRFRTQFMQTHGQSVRNLYRYHEEILNAMQAYAQAYGPRLDSIGVDAWGGDFVLLNRDGCVSKLPASYRAQCASEDAETIIEQRYGAYAIYRRNGNMRMPTDTLKQLIRLKECRDPSMDDPRNLLFIADVFHYFLGAEPCCEHSLASYARFFNRDADTWAPDILEAFGIPTAILGKIVHAGDVIGTVDPTLVRQAGLAGEVKIIVPCTHDTACAALAVPDMDEDWAFISSGTWSLLGTETHAPITSQQAYAANLSNSTMPLMTNMFKKNITGTWIIQQCKSIWACYSYDEIVNLAEASPDLEMFIDINATDFYAPQNMVAAICHALRQDYGTAPAPENAGAVARIVFQSMALKYRYYLGKILQASGKHITKLYILGGGSKNRLINQFTANATGYPVYTGVMEASSTGNLLLQAYGNGELADKAAMRRVVCDTFERTLFAPRETGVWDDRYLHYLTHVNRDNQW